MEKINLKEILKDVGCYIDDDGWKHYRESDILRMMRMACEKAIDMCANSTNYEVLCQEFIITDKEILELKKNII